MLIAIDQGHGATTNPYPDGIHCEGFQMYQLGYLLYQELKAMNKYSLRCTRNKSADDPTLIQRGSYAKGADLFISLHSNAAADTTVDRVVVIPTFTNPHAEFRNFCRELGDLVKNVLNCKGQTQIFERTYTDVNDGLTKDYYGVIRNAVAAGCSNVLILEHSFHTNPEKAALLSQTDVLKILAKKEAEKIDSWLSPAATPSYWGRLPNANVTYKDLWEILHDPHAD